MPRLSCNATALATGYREGVAPSSTDQQQTLNRGSPHAQLSH